MFQRIAYAPKIKKGGEGRTHTVTSPIFLLLPSAIALQLHGHGLKYTTIYYNLWEKYTALSYVIPPNSEVGRSKLYVLSTSKSTTDIAVQAIFS
jgi:hypothetical protein